MQTAFTSQHYVKASPFLPSLSVSNKQTNKHTPTKITKHMAKMLCTISNNLVAVCTIFNNPVTVIFTITLNLGASVNGKYTCIHVKMQSTTKSKKYNSFLWLVHFKHWIVSIDIHNCFMCNVLRHGQGHVWFWVIHFCSVALSCEIHAFLLDYFSKCIAQKSIRLVQPIVQDNSLYSFMDQETCEH